MNKKQIEKFEKTIRSLFGLSEVARIRIQNVGPIHIFGCDSAELHKVCDDYMHLPSDQRCFEISKTDTDLEDSMTYTLHFRKLP